MQKNRWIAQILILSATLNVVLLSIFFYFVVCDNPLHFAYRPKEELIFDVPPLDSALLNELRFASFEELVERLVDERKIPEGHRVQDLALGILAASHDFDVARGLGKVAVAKRQWKWEEGSMVLFVGLKKEDFVSLQAFARSEKWPLTPKGLYTCIQLQGIANCDPELVSFFCHTTPFLFLETLLARSERPIPKRKVLELALECGWDKINFYLEAQLAESDFSPQLRETFLLDAINAGSKTALALLSRIDPGIEIAGHFYEKPGLKTLRPTFRETPPAAPDPRTHIVQPGESLWLIAQRYHISIAKIVEANQLSSDTIRTGQLLKIP